MQQPDDLDDLNGNQVAGQIQALNNNNTNIQQTIKKEDHDLIKDCDDNVLSQYNDGDGKACDDRSQTYRSNMSESNKTMCRICFSDEQEKDNPLISPCKCSGSMSHVHLKCLRQWLSRNENKKIGVHVTTYVWKAFHCELCKSKLQDSYVHGK